MNVAANLAELFQRYGGEFHRAVAVGSHLVEIDISPLPPKPPIKYDGSWSQQRPKGDTERCIHILSINERVRLKAERKVLLANERKEREKS